MRKISTSLLGILFLMISCSKQDSKVPAEEEQQIETPPITQRNCATNEVLQEQMAADPTLKKRMDDIEVYTQKVMRNPSAYRLVNGVIEIPVVVHVVYNTAQENISDAQVRSQISVLNEDFNNTNADKTLVPAEFTDEDTSVNIRFVLDRTIRINTRVKSWSTNDAVKNSKRGGSDPINPSYYLNMWACNLGQGLLGYAQFPGGNLATDGVVCLYSAFGSRAKVPGGTYTNTYDLGRTATHEVGHWLNLRHIWGDATCGNDQVDDTPTAHGANYGCPGIIAGCDAGKREMTMNYMDYTDDACMYMFTKGQKVRIDAVFAAGGPRASMGK